MAMGITYTSTFILLFFNFAYARMEPKVLGGAPADIEKFPHSVFTTAECSKRSWICGASILNQRMLLTAGHCLQGCVGRYSIHAYAGHGTVGEMTIVRKITKYMVHRDYEAIQCKNDIAVAFTTPNLLLGKLVQRVIIMQSFPGDAEGKVAGWGMDETGYNSHQLKWVAVRMQPKKVCKQLGKLSKGMMCATNAFGTYPSHGDSGSALMLSNIPVQIGVVSFREAELPELVVYSNVSYYYDWIYDSTKKLNCG